MTPPLRGRCTIILRYRFTVPSMYSNSHAFPFLPGGDALLFQVIGLQYLIYGYTVPSMYSYCHALPFRRGTTIQVIGLRYLIHMFTVPSMYSYSHSFSPSRGGGTHYYSKLLAYGTIYIGLRYLVCSRIVMPFSPGGRGEWG